MITQKTIQEIGRVFQISSIVKSIPFRWNSKSLVLENEPNHRNRVIHYALALRIWIRLFFLVVCFQKELKKKNALVSQKYVHIVWILGFFLTSILMYNNLRKKNQVLSFLNKHINFIQYLRVTYTKEGIHFPKNNLERMAKASKFVTGIIMILASIRFVKNPCKPWYYYSMSCASAEHEHPWWWATPFVVLEMIDLLISFSVIQFSVFALLLYTYSSSYWLKEINIKKGGSTTLDILRREENSFLIFRCFQVQSQLFNSCYSSFVTPFMLFSVIVISVTVNVISVRLHNQIKMPGFLIFPMLSVINFVLNFISLPIAAKIHTYSLMYVTSWKPVCGKYGKKFLRSCRPAKISASNIFFIRKFTTFKVFSLIIYWTCRILILMSKKAGNK